jgi:macrolide-specific efflux system membrane fusion protein
MINKKRTIVILAVCAAVILVIAVIVIKKKDKAEVISRIIKPHYGTIQVAIAATGTVLPYNRLEIKPQVNGRMESVLVQEGQKVRTGQILGWMSSTERAALIDAARMQGAGSLKYWEEAYKPIPIVAPIYGTVIVRAIEPGQAVVSTTAILVLSDRLIVKADVDETDIGRVKKGQIANISLDAYPDVKVRGRVDLIEYESKIVNNVTMYQVNIIPDTVPAVFRSGMTADVSIIEKIREKVLMVPSDAVINENQKNYVWVITDDKNKPEKKEIQTGVSDDQNVEVVSGIRENYNIAVMAQKSISLDAKKSSNPFVPTRKKAK